ncbi:hypothetical protein LEP1GSC047_0048 [Leptospira inadai serovar Lyme str. 10]|uniref:Uncharacterized protein n=1 Tax=Leptospira inadai serovar Lyme str. 10 TaxID=1049790 RepID=V6HZ11_9LEPT|nr:hypothetical protein LEP1GSC047_0048 [Leptospira inadai serovar Lyme str. 10]
MEFERLRQYYSEDRGQRTEDRTLINGDSMFWRKILVL